MNVFSKILVFFFLFTVSLIARGQEELPLPTKLIKQNTKIPGPTSTAKPSGTVAGSQSSATADSLAFKHRDDRKDSVAVYYRYLDSSYRHNLDSAINDFDDYFSVPSTYRYLGNNGLAAFPLVFEQNRVAGWDAGFHAFDIYRMSLANTRLYKASKPFTSLSYQLASAKEQMISVLHTQSPNPNISFSLEYKLINAPGFFVNQNTNNNSYRLITNFSGKRKRYNANIILFGNTIRASENGGLEYDSLLYDPNKSKRFSIPVNLGNDIYNPNPFASALKTGNSYDDFTFFYRHSYDLGKRDSLIINDSTTEYLFYPKLRFRHSFSFSNYYYNYRDQFADSSLYASWYQIALDRPQDTLEIFERWKLMKNDFSIIQFPDSRNTAHFFLAGISLENINSPGMPAFHNVSLHGEYRHPTRNRKWDMQLSGEFYFSGLNSGDYSIKAYLSRYLSRKLGYVRLYLSNYNRNPSFIFDDRSAFNFSSSGSFSKENNLSFGVSAEGSRIRIGFRNHLLTNYSYFTDRFHKAQYNKVINIAQLFASGSFRMGKYWRCYLDAVLQQTDKSTPIPLPLFFARSRIAYEGLFFKNLNLSTGIEARYNSPYFAQDYSPVIGQFFPQDSISISNLPDITAFLNFRIKSFTCYLRAENLNTMNFNDGFGFTNNNFAAPHYPTQGLVIRMGVKWFFVN